MSEYHLQFGNLTKTISWSFTFSTGIYPSTCVVRTYPHLPSLESVADLKIYRNESLLATFPDCLLERPTLDTGPDGQFWTLPILDRRWRWRFGYVSGSFNVRRPDGSLIRERSPIALAALLSISMGELNPDLSALISAARPTVQWDRANPAEALANLCNSLGCIPTLDADTNRLVIWKVGEGRELPSGMQTQGKGSALNANGLPSRYRIYGGHTLYQGTFELEAVGEDVDGSIVPINELSYTPPSKTDPVTGDEIGRWRGVHPESIHDVMPGAHVEFVRDGFTSTIGRLARANVYKKYRIKRMCKQDGDPSPDRLGPAELVGTPAEPKDINDIELLPTRIQESRQPDGSLQRLPPRIKSDAIEVDVFGVEFQPNVVRESTRVSFSIASETGIVTFQQPLYRVTGPIGDADAIRKDGTNWYYDPPDVYLEVGYKVFTRGVWERWSRDRVIDPADPFNIEVEIRNEIQRKVIELYLNNCLLFATLDNAGELEAEADVYLDAMQAEDELMVGETAKIIGFSPVSPDGRVRQVTWSGPLMFTEVSSGFDHNPYVPSKETRERQREIDEWLRFLRRLNLVD